MQIIESEHDRYNLLKGTTNEMNKTCISLLSKDRRSLFLNRINMYKSRTETRLFLGYQVMRSLGFTKVEYNIPVRQLFRRSMAIAGSSGSGKTTLGIRIIKEALKKMENIKIRCLDPEANIWQKIKHQNYEHIDMSDMEREEMWDKANEIFSESLTRSYDSKDLEILVIEEATEFALEKGNATDDLEANEKKAFNSCVRAYRRHAQRGRKYKSITMSIFQNPFEFRKSVLRQIKTRFVFQLEDNRQIESFSNPVLMQHAEGIKRAECGICHAYGEGIPNRFTIFKVSQIEKLKTDDIEIE